MIQSGRGQCCAGPLESVPSKTEPESFSILQRFKHICFRVNPVQMTAHLLGVA